MVLLVLISNIEGARRGGEGKGRGEGEGEERGRGEGEGEERGGERRVIIKDYVVCQDQEIMHSVV